MRECRTCGGFGWTGQETNHLKRPTCLRCDGTGRIPDDYEHISKPITRALTDAQLWAERKRNERL